MANRSITSELIMRLRDEVSRPAGQAATALDKIKKAEAGLVDQSKKLGASVESLSKFQKLDQQLEKTTKDFNTQQAALKELGSRILTTNGSTKQLAKNYKNAELVLKHTQKTMEAQKRSISEVTKSFESLSGHALNSAASAEQKLRGQIEATTREMTRQAETSRRLAETEETTARRRETRRRAASGVAGLVGAALEYKTAEAGRQVLDTYREFDNARRYGRAVMGLTDRQQEPLVKQAIHGGATTKFNDIQWLETQRELASRGYDMKQVMAFAPVTALLGQAFDVTMPEAVKGLEGAMLGFKKDTTTFEKAMAAANRTADLEVKASKISGMNFEDIVQLYKYAAAPAQMAHLSEESMLAFGAISKKANMGGDESGVAFRALAKNLISPTSEALVAMRAGGIDYSKYQTAPKKMDVAGFSSMVAQRYGVQLDAETRAGLGRIFSSPKLLGDPSKFTPAVVRFLKASLGGNDAKSLKSIAGLARSYRNASAGQVDANGLMTALMGAMSKNPALANAVFGSKQGGRIFAALGDPKFFDHILDELHNQSQGFAGKVSDERMGGFDGAVSQLEGSVKNLETAIGRALDNDGKGGLLTDVTKKLGEFTQKIAEANPLVLQAGVAAAVAAAGFGALKSISWLKDGFGLGTASAALDTSAGALTQSAEALEAAATRLGGGLPGAGGSSAPGSGASGAGESKSPGNIDLRGPGLLMGLQTLGLALDAPGLDEAGEKRREANADTLENFGNAIKRWTGQEWLERKIHGIPEGRTKDDAVGSRAATYPQSTPAADLGRESAVGKAMMEHAAPLERTLDVQDYIFGQLNDRTNVLQASFVDLNADSGSATRGLADLSEAAAATAARLNALASLSGDGGGGSGGIIKASYGGGGSGGGYSVPKGTDLTGGAATGEHADFIRQTALRLGIDPRVAVAVARSEGLGHFVGDKGTSFGDFQLHYKSNVPGMTLGGLGDMFTRQTGLSARDPKNWKAADKFALEYASKHGWVDWHGAAHIGVRGFHGIGAHPAFTEGPDPDALPRPSSRPKGGAIQADSRSARPQVAYSPTLHFHHHGDGPVDHDHLASLVVDKMHRGLHEALSANFADT